MYKRKHPDFVYEKSFLNPLLWLYMLYSWFIKIELSPVDILIKGYLLMFLGLIATDIWGATLFISILMAIAWICICSALGWWFAYIFFIGDSPAFKNGKDKS